MICLYAQGSKSVGMGHLVRTMRLSELCTAANVSHILVFELDAYAENWVSSSGSKFFTIEALDAVNLDTVVIDAVSIDKHAEQLFSNAKQRVIITPVFNAFQMATHVLVRELSDAARLSIPLSAEVVEDVSFSFITSDVKKKRGLDFSSINIGICLSGGKQDFPYDAFFECIEKVPALASVTLVGEDKRSDVDFSVEVIPFEKSSRSLWHKLSHINLFIGRQGLMVAEALAQSIPVVSLRGINEKQKNLDFIEQGMVKSCEISTQGIEEMGEFLSKKSNIQKAHEKVIEYLEDKDSSSLFRALTKVLK